MMHVVVVGLVAAVVQSAPPEEGLEEKFQQLLARHQSGSEEPKKFEIEEREANVYLRKRSVEQLPAGIESPWVKFEESLAIVGATLDIDKLQAELPDSLIFQLLSGRVPVEIVARITGAAGIGKLDLERVTLAGVDLPPDMVASMVEGDNASPFLPPGFRIGQAFTLPFELDSIHVQQGTAVVSQRASAPLK